jgi:pentatricopeptide repeat protein
MSVVRRVSRRLGASQHLTRTNPCSVTWTRSLVKSSSASSYFATSSAGTARSFQSIELEQPQKTATIVQATLIAGNLQDSLRVVESHTRALLERPVGHWTIQQWRDSIQLLNRWTEHEEEAPKRKSRRRKEKRNDKMTLSGTPQSVVLSFALLERLLVEQQRNQSLGSLEKELIHTDTLNSVLSNWALCWIETAAYTKEYAFHEDAESLAKLLLEYSPETILSRVNAYQTRSRGLLVPNKVTYETLFEGGAASRTPLFAIKILDRMALADAGSEPSEDATAQPCLLLDRAVYSKFINTCANIGDATQTEACIDHMYQHFVKTGNDEFKPTTKDFNAVLLAWTQVKDQSDYAYAKERSQKILRRMSDYSGKGGALEGSAAPNYLSYSLVLKCVFKWLVSVIDDTMHNVSEYQYVGEEAERLLDEIRDNFLAGDHTMRLDVAHYTQVLHIYAALGNAERAEALLERMHEDYKVHNNHRAEPNTVSFNCVLSAWSATQKAFRASSAVGKSSKQQRVEMMKAGERAESIFRRMQELHASGELKNVEPNAESYLALIHCWGTTRCQDAGGRALAILREAESLQLKTERKLVSPAAYGAVIQAYAQLGQAKEAETVAADFHRQFYEAGNAAAKPRARNLAILVNAWAKSGLENAPERAETILQETLRLYDEGLLEDKPNIVTYTTVVECYAKSDRPGSAERAEALLDEMIRRARNGETHLQPNSITYRSVINAYASRGQVEKTQAVLEKMIEDFRRGNKDARPNTQVINRTLAAWSNSDYPDAAQRAVAFLDRMEVLRQRKVVEGKVDVVTYTSLMKVLVNSVDPDAGKQAESLLDEMERRAAEGETSLAPNAMTYSIVIKIYGRCGNPDRAEAILERMHRKYNEGNANLKPDTTTFTSVLQAWSRSHDDNASDRCLAILQRMKELHSAGVLDDVKPNCFTYAAVLSCLARDDSKKGASRLAIELLGEVEELGEFHGATDVVCYNNALRVFARDGDGTGAQHLLARMYHRFETGKLSEKPSHVAWNSIVEAWSKSDDRNAHLRAEAIVDRIQTLHKMGDLDEGVSAMTFFFLLSCYVKARKDVPRDKILRILHELSLVSIKELSMFQNLMVIRLLCQMEDGEFLVRAENVLERMLKECDRSKPSWNPNAVLYAHKALIAAWGRSPEKGAGEYARRLRHQIKHMNLQREERPHRQTRLRQKQRENSETNSAPQAAMKLGKPGRAPSAG